MYPKKAENITSLVWKNKYSFYYYVKRKILFPCVKNADEFSINLNISFQNKQIWILLDVVKKIDLNNCERNVYLS